MRVERPLQVCVALMAILGTALLSLEKHDPTLSVVVLFASATSVVFTDALAWFTLPPLVANVAATVAVAHTLRHVLGRPTEAQLLTVADLLVYLQVILLYQAKTPRRYWQLMALSLLQVVVAAALNLVFVFGILLTVYLFTALIALSLFFLYRESLQIGAEAGPGGGAGAADLFHREARVVRGLCAQSSWIGVITLITTIVVFFLLPRHEALWKRKQSRQQRMVGFTDEVNLDDLGPILESPETVMRVTFTEYGSEKEYEIWSEPYFRGAILSTYIPGEGRWLRSPHHYFRMGWVEPQANTSELVRQVVVMEGDDHRILFSVMPAYAVDRTPRQVRFDRISELLLISDTEEMQGDAKTRYVVATDAFERGIERPLRPAYASPRFYDLQELTRFDQRCQEELSGLAQLAADILDNSRAGEQTILGKARALEAHFLAAGRYTYSLDNTQKRNPALDPIEDFVTNHRSGHCEYFASALTLMLRSQGIPARMVVGYKGGEFNGIGNYFQVRQLHAHAWVEVYLLPDQIAQLRLRDPDRYRRGAWLRLDPTPGGGDTAVGAAGSGLFSWMVHWADYAQLLWNDYVLGMNPERQRRAIYAPLVTSARATWQGLLSPHTWEERLVALATRTGLTRLAERRIDWQLLLITLPVAVGVMGVGYLAQGLLQRSLGRLWNWLRYPLHTARRADNLFRRVERRAARLGLVRPAGQTPLEFACYLEREVKPAGPGAAPDLPRRVVEALYRSRFGGRTLDSQLLDQLQHDLSQWEQGLRRRAVG